MAMEPLSIEICWWTWLKKLGIRVEGPQTKQQYQQIYSIKTYCCMYRFVCKKYEQHTDTDWQLENEKEKLIEIEYGIN